MKLLLILSSTIIFLFTACTEDTTHDINKKITEDKCKNRNCPSNSSCKIVNELALCACNEAYYFGEDKLKCIKKGLEISNNWNPVGNVDLSIRFDDEDNGDGENDGALAVDGLDTLAPHGLTYTLNGGMINGEEYKIETVVYNYTSSYVKYYVQLYNLTDNKILSSSELISITGNYLEIEPVKTSLNYKAKESDSRDTLQIRYIRGALDENSSYVNNDGHVARNFAVDNLSFNGTYVNMELNELFKKPIIDIPSLKAEKKQIQEMDLILERMSDWILGTLAPSESELNEAIQEYNTLNITVSSDKKVIDGEIIIDHTSPGTEILAWKKARFIKTFVRYLKFNPADNKKFENNLTIKEMAIRTIWLFTYKFYRGVLREDYINYFYKLFAVPAVFLIKELNEEQYELFYYALFKHSNKFMVFWSKEYITGITDTGAINMDDIGNISNLQLIFALMQKTEEERLQWVKAFKRYYERFMTYSPGTSDGIKSDGSSFHHFTALNNYTYNYNTAMRIISILSKTSFQISTRAYKVLRDAIYTQMFLSNDNVAPLSMSGRHPDSRKIDISKKELKRLIESSVEILNSAEADPILTAAYVRLWGNDNFPDTEAEKLSGFAQFNYHTSGAFWKDNWLAVSRGQTKWSFGAEIFNYPTNYQNIYGRYQSYGALEIIYKGGEKAGNGFNLEAWNWNYNPGATTIVLPWKDLIAEYKQQKELQKSNFTASLAFKKQNKDVLSKTHGKIGIFAMNFEESLENKGTVSLTANTHDESFRFKKSVFFFNDYILSLGSNINNEDTINPTVTTIFQRASDINKTIVINNSSFSEDFIQELSGSNWLIDNYNTGYYIPENNDSINIKNNKNIVPQENEPNYNTNLSSSDYALAYINHGVNPFNSFYEYIIKPNVSKDEMQAFVEELESNKPYKVIQKDENAHIVKELNEKIYAFALFSENTKLVTETIIESNDSPCLIVYQEDSAQSITLSLVNPDLGFEYRSFDSSSIIPIKIKIKGIWKQESESTSILKSLEGEFTILEFQTFDGLVIETKLLKQD